jgi:hypothetical protein
MRFSHKFLPYLPFLVLAIAALVAAQHVFFYW